MAALSGFQCGTIGDYTAARKPLPSADRRRGLNACAAAV
jgi:hypothetical protein